MPAVYVRWRPPSAAELSAGVTLATDVSPAPAPLSISLAATASDDQSKPPPPWTSPRAFADVLPPDADNRRVFSVVVEPGVARVLRGASCSYFAYGHSGSGKTHTIIGYSSRGDGHGTPDIPDDDDDDDDDDDADDAQLGLCLAAAKRLFSEITALASPTPLGIGLSVFELRKDAAYDLLSSRTRCHVREGADKRVHIRGPTEMLADGRVRVRPVAKRACWTFGTLRRELASALADRAVGRSTVHDQSSRTHAVMELEIVSAELAAAREAVVERQSELVPVGKRATDIAIEEQLKGVVRTPEGGWAPNPEYTTDQARIDAAEAEKRVFEERVADAEARVAAVLAAPDVPALGGRMVFVDLAGAEFHHEKGGPPPPPSTGAAKQTPQERQEGRQINTDLLALKEVMRAWGGAAGSGAGARVPFRASPLTMVLREHFEHLGGGGEEEGEGASTAAVVVTVSPARAAYAATLNSLKYGGLVGGV
jgi:hypothetical protein